MKIAVCDDMVSDRNQIAALVDKHLLKRQLHAEICLFASGEQLLESETSTYDIIFLDILMPGINGIDTARKIREHNRSVLIVFVSRFYRYSLQGYEVNAYRYIIKGSFSNIFNTCMNDLLDELKVGQNSFVLDFEQGSRTIYNGDLVYIESQLHRLYYHVRLPVKSVYTQRGKLDIVEASIACDSFLRLHQSYLANMMYISDVKNYNAHLYDGTKLPIPAPKYRAVKNKFDDYTMEHKYIGLRRG